MKLAGGIRGRELTPTIDGNFDRISFAIDPAFGTEEEFVAMSRAAAAHNAVVIDDIIPAHTGKGADFRLADLAYGDYPGLYHMVEIQRPIGICCRRCPQGARRSISLRRRWISSTTKAISSGSFGG